MNFHRVNDRPLNRGIRSILLPCLLCHPIMVLCQFQVNVIHAYNNSLVYDAVSDRIYASFPSANGPNGNSIGIIEPITAALENTVFIGSEPTALAISDDGQFIYAGFSGSATIRRFDVPSQTADIQFPLGSDPFFGPYYAEDIEVMPGQNTTIAVSRMRPGVSPRHGGVAIYDNEVMRPVTTQSHTGSNRIEFQYPDHLWGYNNETTEFGLRRLHVTAAGVEQLVVSQNIISGFGNDILFYDERIYARNGQVVNVSMAPYVIGQFNANGPVTYDAISDMVCYAHYTFNSEIIFRRFDPNTFLLIDEFPVPIVPGNVKSIVTCGNGCYAFNTEDRIVILKEVSTNLNERTGPGTIRIHPNPATDMISIAGPNHIKQLEVFDMNGRTIRSINGDIPHRINVSDLSAGTYMVRISDEDGAIHTGCFMK